MAGRSVACEVVQVRTGTGSSQVAAHGDVGGEDPGRQEPPRLAKDAEGDQRAGQENEAFKAEPAAGRPDDSTLGWGERPLPRRSCSHQAGISRPGSGTPVRALSAGDDGPGSRWLTRPESTASQALSRPSLLPASSQGSSTLRRMIVPSPVWRGFQVTYDDGEPGGSSSV